MVRNPMAAKRLLATLLIGALASVALPTAAKAETRVVLTRDTWGKAAPAALNVIYADANVVYWFVPYVASGDVRTEIDGVAPQARFWSLGIAKTTTGVTSELRDTEMALKPDGSYHVTITDDCSGVSGNCLSTTAAAEPTVSQLLIYRLMVPNDIEGDGMGEVELPAVTYVLPGDGGTADLRPFELPAEARRTVDTILETQASILSAVFGASTPLAEPVPEPQNDPPPPVYDFASQDEVIANYLRHQGAPEAVLDVLTPLVPPVGRGGFFGTEVNKIQYTFYDYRRGNLLLTARAPTYRHQFSGPRNDLGRDDGGEELRYWTICTTSVVTRTIACLRDEEVTIAEDEEDFEIVVAPECPVSGYENCLSSGLEPLSYAIIYRNGLASEAFEPEQLRGDYALRATYVSRP